MDASRLLSGGLLACTLAAQAAAHVTLRYPLPLTENDFLDNVRTKGLCGDGPTGEGAAWLMPGMNESTPAVTSLTPGQNLNVSWDLHYAHQGGFMLELYDAEMKLKHAWNSEDHWGCAVDSTVQEVTVALPAEPCADCTLRFTRQALEWGAGYLFKSCAKVNIGAAGDACQGCSGRGTCGANGQCTCNSSAETGFFYGPNCERENECAADADCGANGKCIDVGDVSGPALQCFCEAGFFGEVETRPSGLQVRTCTRASGYSVPTGATFDNFLDAYNTTWESAGGSYKAGIAAMNGSTEIEMAMAAQTTSWVAIGLRAVAPAGGAKPAGAEGASEPEAEAESTKPAGAEEDYPKPAGADSEPAAEAEAGPATAPAAEAEAPSRRRRLAQAEGAPAEGAPAEGAPAEGAPAEGAPAEGAPAEGAPAEGAPAEGAPAGGVCAVQTTVYVPGMLGAGEAQNGTAVDAAAPAEGAAAPAEGAAAPAEGAAAPAEGAAAPAEGVAAPAEGAVAEAPAGAEGAPTAEGAAVGGRRLLNMPMVEAEATAFGRRGGRGLLDDHGEGAPSESEGAGAESEGAGAESEGAGAESEGGGAVGKPTEITTGPCAGFKMTDPGAHAMANQDVVFGAARQVAGTQYFRVVDMFTPSRAKPQPDHVFCFDGTCGSDSIEDAIGMEVAGVSYFIVKRKAIPDAGSLSDTCITEGQNYHVIYAYGQLTANASHTPDSALEIIPDAQKSNQDFYQVDELKYHGGGIGVTYDGRGTLTPSADILAAPAVVPAGVACTPSPEDGFECMSSQLGGQVLIHYNLRTPTDSAVTMAIETPNPGWVALGWPETPGQMVGATAVIATTSASNGNIGVFELQSKAVEGIVEVDGATARRRLSQTAVTITETTVEKTAGRTLATFTRAIDAEFTGEGDMDLICAYHASSAELAYHTSREAFTLSLDGAAALPVAAPLAAEEPAEAPTDGATPTDQEEGAPDAADRGVDASSAPAPLSAAAAVAAVVALAVALL